MTNCLKKHWFLIIGILLLSNYSFGQTFLSLADTLKKPNGRPFIVKLNPTSSIAEACTSQTIKLDIGTLEYLPGSNGPIPDGIVITPATSNGRTILTISGIVNDGKQGSSLLMDIAMQFKPGTCNGVTEEIKATTTNIGCNVISDQIGNATVEAFTLNNPDLLISNTTGTSSPYCPRKILKYTFYVRNSGNSGFNLNNVKINVELDKCVTLMDVYKGSTYVSLNPVVTSGSDKLTVSFNINDLLLSPSNGYEQYDVYFMYPCLNNTASDCVAGIKTIKAYLTGNKRDCGETFTTADKKVSDTHSITTTDAKCGDVSCLTGGNVGETGSVDYINYYNSFLCPSSCLVTTTNFYFGFSFPPFLPAYKDRKILVDIPAGINVNYSYSFYETPCGTPYVVKYIDAQGNKQSTPFPGTLTRQIELTTDCTISAPTSTYVINFVYDAQNPPLPGSDLMFNLTYTSEGNVIIQKKFGSTIQKCDPSISLSKQVRKASQLVYENNYNASAVPGELMTYRQEVYNYGTGDLNNLIVDPIDERLTYEGGLKYAFASSLGSASQFTPLIVVGEKTFTLPELGNMTVSVPTVGTSGTVTISKFNFPCTTKRLYIEYNVRVKNNVVSGTQIPNVAKISGPAPFYGQSQVNYITIAAFTYVKSKMFVKCGLANEWNDSGINVKNGEVVDFKMQFSNAGSTPVVLSELINLRPQVGDLFEFGSNSRKSTLDINYNCDLPKIFTNATTIPSLDFKYALNSPTMDRDMLCPPRSSGNTPVWIPSCDSSNWLKATFLNNFTLLPGDYVEVVYKGRVTGTVGTAYNSFAFKVGNCNVLSANSNTLALVNDNVGIGCNSCTLTNPYSGEMKKLFEDLLKNILTRKINGETDLQINGSSPSELTALKPYITNGGGNRIYNFVSTKNAENKITSIKFSFSADSDNDVVFLEEKGVEYNPEVGVVDPSYLRIDPTVYTSSGQYLTTCRKTLDSNGVVTSECNSKTQIKNIDFCPTRFCYPMSGEIKTEN